MKKFLLNIIGVDTAILYSTKSEKHTGFIIAGIITASLFLIAFISSCYLMTYLVSNMLLDLFIALIFSSIVFNFYSFTLSSIIWRSDRFDKAAEVKRPEFSSTLIKILTCSFFIIIISKPIELWIFHSSIFHWMGKETLLKNTLYGNFAMLHQHHTFTWIITATMLAIFLWPILFRSWSTKWGNKEYESKHFETLVLIIRTEFEKFEEQYNEIYRQYTLQVAFSFEERYYDKNDKIIRHTAWRTQYANPPFNTLLKDKVVNTKGTTLKEAPSKEFFDFLDNLPVQQEAGKKL